MQNLIINLSQSVLEINLTPERASGRANAQREGLPQNEEDAGLSSEVLRARLEDVGLTEMAQALDNNGIPPQTALHMLQYNHVSSVPQVPGQ
eukprot:5516902-Karenia_brevis.AAC.1